VYSTAAHMVKKRWGQLTGREKVKFAKPDSAVSAFAADFGV